MIGQRTPKPWKHGVELRHVDDRASDLSGERRVVLMKKSGEPVKIGERILRPLDLY